MKNLWSDRDARAFVRHYAADGVNEDWALRTYTTRLLGGEPRLVLHGGGNTSVKTVVPDMLGNDTKVLCVKGSGWDMGQIEPAGLPAVRLDPLLELANRRSMSDEAMVAVQRANLIDPGSPNPSVETLLHALLPHKFIDHTHANAVVALTDTENGDEICRELYGNRMAYVPFVMPGFDLSRKAMAVFRAHPDVEGLVLMKHGIFTFGETAREAYCRMIERVTEAEKRLARGRKRVFPAARLPRKLLGAAEIAPVLRGLLGDRGGRFVMDFRTGPTVLDYVNGKELARYSQKGTPTPEHVIRAKAKPMIVGAPKAGGLAEFRSETGRALEAYIDDYRAYFKRNNAKSKPRKTELDPLPRVILVPGVGLFGLGANAKSAAITADIAVAGIDMITAAESVGTYEVITEKQIFDVEYWSLEQAKLKGAKLKPLEGRVVAVTGGGSGIGAACARAFAAEGAEVSVLDVNAKAAKLVASEIGGLAAACDVTKAGDIKKAFAEVCKAYGGLDIVVFNAGAAWQGRIGEVDEATLRKSFELNFWAHQAVAREAVRIMRAQGGGGCLLFNTSKQAVNPGKDFGPYGLPKASTLFLMRQYALDYGSEGIRANAVNADRIRSGLLTDRMIESRAKARGVSESDYMGGNLLGREVTADDVAKAFVDLAKAEKTTAAVITVDGGNIAAALR